MQGEIATIPAFVEGIDHVSEDLNEFAKNGIIGGRHNDKQEYTNIMRNSKVEGKG